MTRKQSATLHVPPKYNLRGNRQVWFFETGNDTIDNFGNGLLTALVVIGPLALLMNGVSAL